jgi:hypothetical protein
MFGEPDQFACQEIQRPPSAALRRVRAGRCDQQRFFFARELTAGSRTRLLSERCLQIPEYEAAFGSIDRRAPDPQTGRDRLVGGALISCQ